MDELRARSLESYEILDSAPETSFDDLAYLAAYLCNAPAALICFLTPGGQWIKASWANASYEARLKSLPRQAMVYDARLHRNDGILLSTGEASPALAALKLRLLAAAPLSAPDGLVLGSLLVLDRRARTLSAGQCAALGKLSSQTTELLELRRTLVGLSQANARLGQQNMTDSLTGIPNRRAYDHKLAAETSRAQRTGEALSLLLVDIDHFKGYNDEYGHPAGDTALQSVARLLLSALRPYDFLARYGGEEFAVILPSTDLTDALLVAERLRGLIAATEFPHRKLSISIGLSRLDADSGARALVLAADNGLYRAKAAGRNKVVIGKLKEGELSGSARA
ncbi:MAG TPA: GGDEF domain-containing protein [Acidocella sp.]|nr:GGDEF domain-containing protein [Acidocella sp.]